MNGDDGRRDHAGDAAGSGTTGQETGRQLEPAGPAPTVRDQDDLSIKRLIRVVLTIGIILGAILLIIGFLVWMVRGGSLPASVENPQEALRSIARLEPIGFFSWGLLVIILTPFVNVAGFVAVFLRGREWVYVAVTTTVLLSMIAGFLVGAL